MNFWKWLVSGKPPEIIIENPNKDLIKRIKDLIKRIKELELDVANLKYVLYERDNLIDNSVKEPNHVSGNSIQGQVICLQRDMYELKQRWCNLDLNKGVIVDEKEN